MAPSVPTDTQRKTTQLLSAKKLKKMENAKVRSPTNKAEIECVSSASRKKKVRTDHPVSSKGESSKSVKTCNSTHKKKRKQAEIEEEKPESDSEYDCDIAKEIVMAPSVPADTQRQTTQLLSAKKLKKMENAKVRSPTNMAEIECVGSASRKKKVRTDHPVSSKVELSKSVKTCKSTHKKKRKQAEIEEEKPESDSEYDWDIAKEIKKQVEGKIETSGSHDLLSIATKKPESRGHVRGIGGHAKPSSYFNLPRAKRLSVAELVEETIEAKMKVERAKLEAYISNLKAEADAQLEARLTALEAIIGGKPHVSPKKGVSVTVSCLNQMNKDVLEQEAIEGTMPPPSTKCLDLEEIVEPSTKPDEGHQEVGNGEDDKVVVDDNVEVEEQAQIEEDKDVVTIIGAEAECKLRVASDGEIVAIGYIVEIGEEGQDLGVDNAKVSIVRGVINDARIPFTTSEGEIAVEDAIGSVVMWPKKLISFPSMEETTVKRRKTKSVVNNRISTLEGETEFEKRPLSDTLPKSVKRLCLWVKKNLKNGTMNFTLTSKEAGFDRKTYMFKSDVYNLAEMNTVGITQIQLWIKALYKKVVASEMQNMVGFVDSTIVNLEMNLEDKVKSHYLARRFMQDYHGGQLFLVPYNSGDHWVLTAINPDKVTVYHMDPMTRRLPSARHPWKPIVDSAIRIYLAEKKRDDPKKIQWVNCGGIPQQNNSIDCGYYVMKYMQEIVEDIHLEFHSKWSTRTKKVPYSKEELDALRNEWAEFILQMNA